MTYFMVIQTKSGLKLLTGSGMTEAMVIEILSGYIHSRPFGELEIMLAAEIKKEEMERCERE